MNKELITKTKLLGNYKVIIGDGTTDIVLNTLSNVFIKTGNKFKPIRDIFKALEELNNKSDGVIISDNTENIDLKEGQLIIDSVANSLNIIYLGSKVPIIDNLLYKEDLKKPSEESDNKQEQSNSQKVELPNTTQNSLNIVFLTIKLKNDKVKIDENSNILLNNIKISDIGNVVIDNKGLIIQSNKYKEEITPEGVWSIKDSKGEEKIKIEIKELDNEVYGDFYLKSNPTQEGVSRILNFNPESISIKEVNKDLETVYKGLTTDIVVNNSTLLFKNGLLYNVITTLL